MKRTEFEKQNDELFNNLIENFYKSLELEETNAIIELFVTPHCNQHCEYCYLQKHKNDLYPIEAQDNKIIISNMRKVLDYYLERNFKIPRLDLFSGEIYGYPFGNQIFDILLEYLDKGLCIDFISVPTNGSFAFSKDILKVLDGYIYKFSQRNCRLNFSISYDGPVLDSLSRPLNNNNIVKDEAYLTRLCKFMRKNILGFHPMIAPNNIEQQIDNYKAWTKLIQENFPVQDPLENYGLIMQLECREHGWTEDKIVSYLKWLKFLIDTDLDVYFQGNKKDFARFLNKDCKVSTLLKERGMNPSGDWDPYFPYTYGWNNARLGCSLGIMLDIRLGDLAIVPCHRTSYPKYTLGHYELDEEGKICGVSCNNLPLASSIYVTSFMSKPVCCNCAMNDICTRYCMGANHEQTGELYYPDEDNCNLQKAKVIFCYYYMKKLDIEYKTDLGQVANKLKQLEPEVFNKWYTITQKIICEN